MHSTGASSIACIGLSGAFGLKPGISGEECTHVSQPQIYPRHEIEDAPLRRNPWHSQPNDMQLSSLPLRHHACCSTPSLLAHRHALCEQTYLLSQERLGRWLELQCIVCAPLPFSFVGLDMLVRHLVWSNKASGTFRCVREFRTRYYLLLNMP
ncbi:uncharacterized protein PHACADRAFT_257447 [Phanerochaete carnosa HHB-10118-sp]|uniref:Uncharacterized protein n=1 Tax=Phanerochaete carnosa (strain HHB-10118-sp) TaxID=650164 RepID=K5UVB5_PHACS|nr:uncharacterized protein PHACADRAFT_257447 [Phanerochaete carnosa HHB-10118-sp]EKM53946.1 hypothetical protein PHACADRAFT_257447 [Phanerochaete carnosa HHB-10118-sp]